jgi:hypothetical protein
VEVGPSPRMDAHTALIPEIAAGVHSGNDVGFFSGPA